MRFQQRDIEILQWVNSFGFATAVQISGFMRVVETTAYIRLKKLVMAGYLSRERVLHGQARIHRVTKMGVLASGDELLPLPGISLATFRHDMMLVDLALRLERETGGTFLPDRRIRHNEGLSGVGQFGHIPDGYLYLGDDKPIAIELELTVKSWTRLQYIVNGYGGNLNVKEVWYFTGQPGVARAVEKAANGYSFIKVLSLSSDSQINELAA
jgi:hypothetical protein